MYDSEVRMRGEVEITPKAIGRSLLHLDAQHVLISPTEDELGYKGRMKVCMTADLNTMAHKEIDNRDL